MWVNKVLKYMTDALDRASVFLSNNAKVNINNIYVNYSLHIALILIKFVSIIKTILNNSYI